MEWKIDRNSGHCGLDNGISAYVDFQPTSSGAIRCVGPLSSRAADPREIRLAMAQLTLQLEQEHLDFQNYVVWGSYTDTPTYMEHSISILGALSGFIPVLWLRGNLLDESPSVESREWLRMDSALLHRSGLSFPFQDKSNLDAQLFHPSNFATTLRMMTNLANRRTEQRHGMKITPIARWTPFQAQAVG